MLMTVATLGVTPDRLKVSFRSGERVTIKNARLRQSRQQVHIVGELIVPNRGQHRISLGAGTRVIEYFDAEPKDSELSTPASS